MDIKQKIALLRGQGNQTDLGGVLADILDELSESGGGVRKLTITRYLAGFVGQPAQEEAYLAETLRIEVSELRALCNGDYDVLVQEVEGKREEWRQAMMQDYGNNSRSVYFTVVEAMTSHYMITQNYSPEEDVYTYVVSFI